MTPGGVLEGAPGPVRSVRSPDGKLVFLVVADGDDVALGFDGCPWHTHPELFAPDRFAGARTVDEFLDALFRDKLIVAVLRERGEIQDIWITDDPVAESRWLAEGEAIEFRYWSGATWRPRAAETPCEP